ncbi:MAG: PepSY domain-containing protein [Tissierella sp.]|uniref:PepSY domain-containing protein n=1 Tax=Tissierella sp. TaxID=41274 RepID=UPI003F954648
MIRYEEIKLTPSEAFQVFVEKYPNTTVKEVELDTKSNSYVYKVEGYDKEKRYKLYINPVDGSILELKEKLRKGSHIELTKINTEKIQDLVDSALKDAGEGSVIDEWSLEIEDGMLELKVEIDLKDGEDVEYKYNLETGELIKKDS